MQRSDTLPQKGRTKYYSLMLISFLVVALLFVPMVSAVWWNPFTWFGDNTAVVKGATWVQTYNNNPDFYAVIPDNTKHDADIYLCSYSATKKNDLKDLDFATSNKNNTKELKTKEKLKAIEYNGKFCYYYKPSGNDKYLKFDKHFTHFVFTNESIIATENGIEIGRMSLITEDYNYKNGKPNIETSRGTDKLTHTFYLTNYSADAITNLRTINMKDNTEVQRNAQFKWLSYVDVEVPTYKDICSDVINGTNITSVCNPVQNGKKIIQQEQWNDMNSTIVGQNYIIGIFSDVLKEDYVDADFDYYGTGVALSPIYWTTWTEDLNTNLNIYYSCEDNLATTNVLDSLGVLNGVSGRNTNVFSTASGKVNRGFDFDGTNDNITVSNFQFGGSSGSISFWMNMDTTSNVQLIDGDNVANGINMQIFGTGKIYARVGGETFLISATLSAETWYHVVFTWDGANHKLYIDAGTPVSKASAVGTSTDSRTIHIAQINTGNFKFNGKLDEIGIWDRALSASEVTQLYNSGTGITYTSGTAPSVTLTSPPDTENLTSATVEHIATVTDDQYIQNVTLYLDGVANETITSHVNGSYTFTKTVAEGVHIWSILAYDNQSLSNQSANWTYNYTQPPIYINLLSPADASTSQIPLVNVTCIAYEENGVEELNLTINGVVNTTVTNSTPAENLSLTLNTNFAEGNYTWGCQARNPSTSAISSNRTFQVLYSNPVISLGTPIAYANLTSQTVPFVFNTTDLNGIENVTLYLDGIVNETNSSGINGSYSFTELVIDGIHNWSIVAVSILEKLTTSATIIFYVDSVSPIINITSPPEIFDYLIDGETLDLNWSVADEHLDSCWYNYPSEYEDRFLSNSTSGISNYWNIINGSMADGGYVLRSGLVFGESSYNILSSIYSNPDLVISQLKSTIPICDNETYTTMIPYYNSTIGYYACVRDEYGFSYIIQQQNYASGSDYQTKFSSYNYSRLVDCSLNTTTFNYEQGYNTITFFSEDTFGNVGSETRNWVSLIGTFSIDYETPVYEGYENTITATIEGIPEGSFLTSAILYYNGANYSTSINYNDGDYEVSATLSAPAVIEDTNYTFGFYLTIDGAIYDPQQSNQTVLNANFGVCGGDTNDTILTLNLVDEDSQESIMGDIEIGGEIKSVSSEEIIGTIYVLFNNTNNATLCFSPPAAYDLYYMDAEIRYTSDEYSSELYFIQNADITDDLGNLTLYSLNESQTTKFKVTYQDSTYNFVEGAIIQLQRKYMSEGIYKTVEAPLTSNEGVSILHINLDSILYRATIVKDGVVLDEFDNLVFRCQSELTGECEHKLLGDIDSDNEVNLDNIRDFYYTEPVLINNSVSISFSIPSGSPSIVNIILEQRDEFGNKTLCNKTIASSAGSMSCDYSESLSNSYIDFIIYKNGEAIAKKSYIVHPEDYLDWLGNNYIFIFVLLLSLVGMALTSPEWIIINGIVTMVISGGLYLARGLDFVVGLGSFIWLVIAAIILISKMSKQEDN